MADLGFVQGEAKLRDVEARTRRETTGGLTAQASAFLVHIF